MAQTAFPDVAYPGHPGMVTVAELIRRVSARPSPAEPQPDPAAQVPVENLLRREGRDTGPLPSPVSGPAVASSPPPARRRVRRIAVAAGAVVAAGSVIAGGLWLSQSRGGETVAGVDKGSYPGQRILEELPGASVAPSAPDRAGAGVATLLPPAFPDPTAAAGGTIPVTGGAPVTPAGASGAPSSAASPGQAGGGAPTESGSAAQQTGEPGPAAGPVRNTVNGVNPALGSATAPVTGALDGAVAGLLG